MDENWLTAIFNKYLAGFANALLGLVNLKANDPAHPWETWLVMELLVFALLIVLVAAVRPHFSAERPGRLQHLFETIYDFLRSPATWRGAWCRMWCKLFSISTGDLIQSLQAWGRGAHKV